ERQKRRAARTAHQCLGAQYVASVDPNASGCLVDSPRVGRPMLFARVDAHGRVALVRTGALLSFEVVEDRDLLAQSDGVSTSAPEMKRRAEPDYLDLNAKTQRVQSVEPPPSTEAEPESEPPASMRPEAFASEELDSGELEDDLEDS